MSAGMKAAWTGCLLAALSTPAWTQIEKATVTGGPVQGVVANGVASFKGIPFAAPPVGENRWKAPQPVRPWSQVRIADKIAAGCMQDTRLALVFGAPTDVGEDCLYLNVWTPAKTTGDKLPVMVWIYGGAFSAGMTSIPLYEGTRLAQKGVVLVSVAYRVGPFGFLAHPELSRESGKGSGTYGLLDQIAGLRWVKDNIAKFGGDPANVTIFGESAGAISVSMLTAAPPARGLFQRAISESGGSFAPPKYANEAGHFVPPLKVAEANGQKFLAALGANDLKAARALSAQKIQEALRDAAPSPFWPAMDGHVIVGDQYELYQAGRFNDTPVLIGWNSDEGALFTHPPVKPAQFVQQVRAGYGEKADSILATYPHSTDAEAFRSTKNLFRDSVFGWPTWAWARLQSQKAKNNAYVYYFDHRPTPTADGANHGAEMAFVFGNLSAPVGAEPTPAARALSEMISQYWVNFAKTGNPNGPGLPAWPVFADSAPKVMIFDRSPSARDGVPNAKELKAYDEYFAWRRAQSKTTGTN